MLLFFLFQVHLEEQTRGRCLNVNFVSKCRVVFGNSSLSFPSEIYFKRFSFEKYPLKELSSENSHRRENVEI